MTSKPGNKSNNWTKSTVWWSNQSPLPHWLAAALSH